MNLFLHARLGVRDEAAQIAPAHIGLDHHAPAAVVAADLVLAFRDLDAGDRGQGHRDAGCRRDRKRCERRRIVADLIRQADHHVEATVAFEDLPRLGAADGCGNGVGDLRRGQAVVGRREAIDADRQGRQAGGLFDPHISRARGTSQDIRHLVGRGLQLGEVIAIDHDREVGPDARDQFVEPQLDRLAELEAVAQLGRGQFLEPRDQLFLLQPWIRPFLTVLQDDDRVGDVRRHRVDGRLRGAGSGKDGLHLRLGRDGALDRHLHGEGLFQRGRRNAQRLHGDVAFVQRRDELPAQGGEGDAAHRQRAQRRDQDDLGTADGRPDRRFGPAADPADDEGLVLVRVTVLVHVDLLGLTHQQRRHRRHEGEGEDESPDEGQHDGGAHRNEGLALHPLEHQQGCEDEQDDQLAEGGRLDHLHRRGPGDAQALFARQRPTDLDPLLR